MKKTVKKVVKKKVSPIQDNVKGLKLEHFKLQDRSEFQVDRRIWFQFHYDNLSGGDVGYGSMGMAIHRWNGSEWKLHNYKHSFGGPNGTLRAGGGPGGGPFHDDNWKADQDGKYALTPYISFDREASHKIESLKAPQSVGEVSHMAMPLYVTIGRNGPGGKLADPPAPLFPDKFVEEVIEEVIDVPDEVSPPSSPPKVGTGVKPPQTTLPTGPTDKTEMTRQVIEWHSGSGVGAVRIELSRREGDQWLVHTVLTQSLDADNRVEVVFLEGG